MVRMIKGNIERLVKTEIQKEKLLALGFSVMEDGGLEAEAVIEDSGGSADLKAAEDTETGGGSDDIPLEEMTVAQLRNIAAENNIGGCETMNKKALLESVRLLYKG